MSPEQARRAAHLKLGNTVRIREDIHYMNTISVLDSLGRDLRQALRGMRRNPTFTLAVVLTLALGIGANTAIFAVVDGVLIKPLAYPDAEQLVSLKHVAPGIKVDEFQMSPTQYFSYREEGRVFQQIGIGATAARPSPGPATLSRRGCSLSPLACWRHSASSQRSVAYSRRPTRR